MIGYHIPKTDNPDFYALNILRSVLFQGESSSACTSGWWTRTRSRLTSPLR